MNIFKKIFKKHTFLHTQEIKPKATIPSYKISYTLDEVKELIETEQLNKYVSIHFDCEGYICKIDGNVGCFHLSQQDKKYIAFIVHECGKIQYTELYQTIGEAYAQLIEYLRSYY